AVRAVRSAWLASTSALADEATFGWARPLQCGLSGSLIAVRTTAGLPIPALIMSCNEGTGCAATGSSARASCFVRAERDWVQPAAAKLRSITADTRFMIGLVSILGDRQTRQARSTRIPVARPTAHSAIAAFRENRSFRARTLRRHDYRCGSDRLRPSER